MALPEAELAELRDELDALKKNISARCARRAVIFLEAGGCTTGNMYDWGQRMSQLSRTLAQDEELRRLYNRINEVEPRLLHLEFDLCNETGFADADGTKAVLNVTSGLKWPTTPLPAVSTAEKIAALIEQDLEIVRKRLIGEEIAKRRRALRGADNARLGHLPPAPGKGPQRITMCEDGQRCCRRDLGAVVAARNRLDRASLDKEHVVRDIALLDDHRPRREGDLHPLQSQRYWLMLST